MRDVFRRILACGFCLLASDIGFHVSLLGLDCEPGRQILLCALLDFQPFRDQDDRAVWEQMPRQGSDEWLRCGANARAGQDAPLLQAPC